MLDPDYLNRAAPPGSMRYFALLYTPASQRELLAALFVVEAEIRSSATQVAHEVAHTRLQWWRAEIDRLVNGNAQHPATRLLQTALPNGDFSRLHELSVASDMDLARMTYNNATEFAAYLERSGGTTLELFAKDATEETRKSVRKLGGLIRRAETLRDLAMDARAGWLYWPLDELEASRVAPDELRGGALSDAIRDLLAREIAVVRTDIASVSDSLTRTGLRPLLVLGQLHARLLHRIERADYDIFTRRHELGALEKVWTAWRAARRS